VTDISLALGEVFYFIHMKKDYTAKGTPKKEETVTALTEKIGKAKSMILVEYAGLKHKQLEELRRLLKKSDGEMVIAKNRLLKRALGDKAASIETLLEQPTATLFSYKDEVAPLKDMLKFFKAAGIGKAKGGMLGDVMLSDKEVAKLATLPSKQMLLGKLVGQLNAPIQGLHYALQWNLNKLVWALNSVKEKKA
jgi:large subunit ribosomal protein L10